MWSDWLIFCDYGFSVSALWCPLVIPTVLLGFLLPWTWGICSRLLQQSAAAAPYLGVVSPHSCPSWPWTWSSSSRLSWAQAAAAPCTWGSSYRPLPLTSDVGQLLSAVAPNLRRVQATVLEWVASLFPGDLPNTGVEPGSPGLQADSLQIEPPGKPVFCIGVVNICNQLM